MSFNALGSMLNREEDLASGLSGLARSRTYPWLFSAPFAEAGSQPTVPESSSTSRCMSPMTSRRRNELSVYMTLSGCS